MQMPFVTQPLQQHAVVLAQDGITCPVCSSRIWVNDRASCPETGNPLHDVQAIVGACPYKQLILHLVIKLRVVAVEPPQDLDLSITNSFQGPGIIVGTPFESVIV